jgi:alkylation response protein AidB-like acyl-CoA dehydrogenase
VEGGLVVDGRWPWASGCQVADWITAGVVVAPPAPPAAPPGTDREPGGVPPDVRLVWFPASEVTLLDNWDAAGLCGSGSGDIELQGAFVPEGRWITIGSARPRYRRPLYAFPIFGLLALGVSAVALGIARGAVDALRELAADKVPMGGRSLLADRVLVQVDLARAEGTLRAAEALVATTVDGVWARAEAGERFTLADRADLRLAATWAAQASADVVGSMYRAGGGSSVHRSNPLQRALRDVNTVTQHAMVQDETLHSVGRALLGRPVDNPRF